MSDVVDQDLFGEYDEQGNLVNEADTCILSGRMIEAGDPTFALGRFFYRVKHEVLAAHTPEVREELKRKMEALQEPKKSVPAKAIKPAADNNTP